MVQILPLLLLAALLLLVKDLTAAMALQIMMKAAAVAVLVQLVLLAWRHLPVATAVQALLHPLLAQA
jgi:hypothetical protein